MNVNLTLQVGIKADRMTPEIEEAFENLASLMLVQGERGLWSHGSPDTAAVDGTPSLFVAEVTSLSVVSIKAA